MRWWSATPPRSAPRRDHRARRRRRGRLRWSAARRRGRRAGGRPRRRARRLTELLQVAAPAVAIQLNLLPYAHRLRRPPRRAGVSVSIGNLTANLTAVSPPAPGARTTRRAARAPRGPPRRGRRARAARRRVALLLVAPPRRVARRGGAPARRGTPAPPRAARRLLCAHHARAARDRGLRDGAALPRRAGRAAPVRSAGPRSAATRTRRALRAPRRRAARRGRRARRRTGRSAVTLVLAALARPTGRARGPGRRPRAAVKATPAACSSSRASARRGARHVRVVVLGGALLPRASARSARRASVAYAIVPVAFMVPYGCRRGDRARGALASAAAALLSAVGRRRAARRGRRRGRRGRAPSAALHAPRRRAAPRIWPALVAFSRGRRDARAGVLRTLGRRASAATLASLWLVGARARAIAAGERPRSAAAAGAIWGRSPRFAAPTLLAASFATRRGRVSREIRARRRGEGRGGDRDGDGEGARSVARRYLSAADDASPLTRRGGSYDSTAAFSNLIRLVATASEDKNATVHRGTVQGHMGRGEEDRSEAPASAS